MNKNGIIGIGVLVAVIIGAFLIFNEANEGPLEEAGESLDDAAEDIADELD